MQIEKNKFSVYYYNGLCIDECIMVKYSIDANKSIEAVESTLDNYIGSRVKARRAALGISQNKLGAYLGVTFQQIQKYEKGVNRISASTLYRMADALSVDYSYFFDGFENNCLQESSLPVYEFDSGKKKETTELLRAYYKISNPAVRKKIVALMRALAANEEKSDQ